LNVGYSTNNSFEEIFGFKVKRNTIYDQAFIHKSKQKKEHNERLEFLGDSVLNIIVSDYLFKHFAKDNEGELSKKRSYIISRKNLNIIGKQIIAKDLIKHNVDKVSDNMFGNCLEALIGAIFIKEGLIKTNDFVINKIIIKSINNNFSDIDFKSKLILRCQKEVKKLRLKKFKNLVQDTKKNIK
jgi:ribonuclease-3